MGTRRLHAGENLLRGAIESPRTRTVADVKPRLHSAVLVAALASSSGCPMPYSPPPPPPEPPTRYYSASVEIGQSEQNNAEGDEHGPMAPDAAQLLRPGIKIAFFPPTSAGACETTTAEQSVAKEKDLIVMQCGVLMSGLEARAAKAGYQVVSWQALKHPDRPPLEMARALDVDVLFEINELSVGRRELDRARATNLTFGQQTRADDRTDVAVSPAVAQRCRGAFAPVLAAQGVTLEAVLDAKGVEVRSGRALWYYKRAKPELEQTGEHASTQLYYPAAGHIDWVPPPRPKPNRMRRAGGFLAGYATLPVAMGGALLGLGVAKHSDAMRTGGGVLLGLGLAAVVTGITLFVVGDQRQRRMPPPKVVVPPPSYAPAEQVLCSAAASTPPWLVVAPSPTAAPTSASSFSFHDETAGARDDERRRRERLVRAAADEFVTKLGELHEAR